MKLSVVLIFIFFFGSRTTCQNLSIQLSIEYKDSIFIDDAFYRVPYLDIKYTNTLDYDIYLEKVSRREHGFPIIESVNMSHKALEEFKLKDIILCKDDSFKIDIVKTWLIEYKSKERTNPIFINDQIAMLGINLTNSFQSISETEDRSTYNPLDINRDSIPTKLGANFVFLHPFECYHQRFNLIAFALTKAFYKFCLSDHTISDSVLTGPYWENGENRIIFKDMKLPREVNGYKLYTGEIEPTCVEADFTHW